MSPYDPFGIVEPAMLSTKLLQRETIPPKSDDPHNFHTMGWDDPIPSHFRKQWQEMIKTCSDVQELTVPRSFYPANRGTPVRQQLHAFSDASDLALCTVIYIRTETTDGGIFVSFVAGKTSVMPKYSTVKGQISIPRAELIAADMLAKQILTIEKEIDIEGLAPTQFYTDSKVVLSWIQDDSHHLKRFEANRVGPIRTITDPTDWHYIATSANPADIGTRPITVQQLKESEWLTGPAFLKQPEIKIPDTTETPQSQIAFYVRTLAARKSYFQTDAKHATEDVTSGEMWKQKIQETMQDKHITDQQTASEILHKTMQNEAWPNGLVSIDKLQPRERKVIMGMSPFADPVDLLIKGGCRLENSDLTFGRKHPTLIPDTLLGDALIGHLHASQLHQGRRITAAAVRDQGYCAVGGKRRIQRVIAACITCRKLRAPPMQQKMADLPAERLYRTPPFYKCGIDVFGHFHVKHGKATRRNTGTRKVWVLLFTCLYSRAIHLEILDSMDTAAFINALVRFEAVRGKCVYLRSDHGSNFMGARNDNSTESPIMDLAVQKTVQEDWQRQGRTWEVNPPLASHFGGVWERAIGQVRQILEA